MNTREQKLADNISNLVEDHWFNPAAVARHLSNQPIYTIDRVMELVAWIIEKNARQLEDRQNKDMDISEGIWLANELDKVINKYKVKYKFDNIKLP